MKLPRRVVEINKSHELLLRYLVSVKYKGCSSESDAIKKIIDHLIEYPQLLDNDTTEINHEQGFKEFCQRELQNIKNEQ